MGLNLACSSCCNRDVHVHDKMKMRIQISWFAVDNIYVATLIFSSMELDWNVRV